MELLDTESDIEWKIKHSLRSFQIKIIDFAIKQNAIVYLPPGSGKTFIAIKVLSHFASELKKPFKEGGKRAFFITNTKMLAIQIKQVIETITKFDVNYYIGDMLVDFWSFDIWYEEFCKNHVLVMTGDIFRNILTFNYINPKDICLVVLDECHHAVNDHPFNKVMKILLKAPLLESPRIIGLSCVLINSTPKKGKVIENVQMIENALRAKIVTETQLEELLPFSVNVKDVAVTYEKHSTSSYETVIRLYRETEKVLNEFVLETSDSFIPEGASSYKSRNKAKIFKNIFSRTRTHLEEYGAYCGSLSALLSIIILEKNRIVSNDVFEIQLIIYARTQLNKARRLLAKIMGEQGSPSVIYRFSSPKIQALIKKIKESRQKFGEIFSMLIFVKEKSTAIVLSYMLKKLGSFEGDFDFIKADFLIGTTASRERVFIELESKDVINKFASSILNVVVATSVLEEGMDVSSCNTVVSFDFPTSYSSYFQSRGRARYKGSIYYIFIKKEEVEKKLELLNEYKRIEQELFQIVSRQFEDDNLSPESNDDSSKETIEFETDNGLVTIDGLVAQKLVEKYCHALPHDKFFDSGPKLWYVNVQSKKQAFLELPITSPLRETIKGNLKENSKDAKRSVFLKALMLLRNMKELNKNLLYSFKDLNEDFIDLFPNYVEENIDEELPQPGTKKRKQRYSIKFAECLTNCMPEAGARSFIHVLKLSFANQISEKPNYVMRKVLESTSTFAMISSKKLSKICQFPIFLKYGQMDCDVLTNYDEVVLTETEINDLKTFHFSIFKKILNLSTSAQVFDNRNGELSFFIAPVDKDENNHYFLNWNVIRCDFIQNTTSAVVRYNPYFAVEKSAACLFDSNGPNQVDDNPTNALIPFIDGRLYWNVLEFQDKENLSPLKNSDAYFNFVISPNYRKVEPRQFYVVSKICYNLNPLSKFPNEDYIDFADYYRQKYEKEIINMNQPLLRVESIFTCSNFNRPYYKFDFPPKKKDNRKNFEELLIPELCDVIPFLCDYWVKVLLLPTILNRIAQIYLIDEFRKKVAKDLGHKNVELPPGASWKPLKGKKIFYNPINYEKKNHKDKITALPLSKIKEKTLKTTSKPILSAERNLFEVGVCDLKFLENEFRKKQNAIDNVEKFNVIEKLKELQTCKVPHLSIFEGGKEEEGPELCDLLEATTSVKAHDLINYERLEILGDSLMKFYVCLTLFHFDNFSEGKMSILKSKMVGNKNLYYSGLARGIQNIINVIDFAPLSEWRPPLLCLPDRLMNCILWNQADSSVIYQLEVPLKEQFSGKVSEETYQKNEEIIKEYFKTFEIEDNSLLPFKIVSDKVVSDCVESLTGLYLQASGLHGAFNFLKWMQILPNYVSFDELLLKPYEMQIFETSELKLTNLLNLTFYADLENTLNYEFKNKALILEALTHPSYIMNRVTCSYQRLEFLGDAILDILITSYLYEHCNNLTPEEITNIRSALVNNITFACLAVRYEFHKYLLSLSPILSKMIENFVLFQIERNHVVDENMEIILEESSEFISFDCVPVPKVLGDLFESIAGAIFLDSGNSLETVWNIYYKMMKQEIDEFTKTVPKNSLSLLHEICKEKPHCETSFVGNQSKVVFTVFYNNQKIVTQGFGKNKNEAKRCAAKLVIRKILKGGK